MQHLATSRISSTSTICTVCCSTKGLHCADYRYRFPESSEYGAMTIPDDALKTEQELEEEDKIAQGAVCYF